MQKKPEGERRGLTRREVLAGAATAALVASAPAILAAPMKKPKPASRGPVRINAQLRRYMAASVTLSDGRILITGGYDRPWDGKTALMPLRSAVIYDPLTKRMHAAAPMGNPRARHAAVSLEDGRVAVVGGMGMNPTASVEVYDPVNNVWTAAQSLAQPRYDHSAAAHGQKIYVLGGSGQSMLANIEVLDPDSQVQLAAK
jgi:hypothetical protein